MTKRTHARITPHARVVDDRQTLVRPPVTDPAGALIAEVSRPNLALPAPPPEGIAALRRLAEHNDAQGAPRLKVGAAKVIDMLRTHYGWRGESISSLNALCRRELGRKSWGTP